MTHYVCTGECHGESKNPGVCQAEDCSKKGHPLQICDCEDWHHDKVLKEKIDDLESVSNLDDEEDTEL